MNNDFKHYVQRKGIIHEVTLPYTPEYNGVIERHRRSINERIRVYAYEGKLPNNLWPECVKTAVYIFNCTVQKGIGEITPYEHWNRKKPNNKHWRIIGCIAFVLERNTGKLGNKTNKCKLLGYKNDSVYRLWNHQSQRIIVLWEVIFDEKSAVSR